MTASSFAVEAEINGLWYELVSKTKEATVIQYKNSVKYSGNIVIPETVEYNGANYGYDRSEPAKISFTVDRSDVNQDGRVDVADIATIIDRMAGKARMQEDITE